MCDSIEVLNIKLQNTINELEGAINRKRYLENEILKHSKYKAGDICFAYTDNYYSNNQTWCKCEIESVKYVVNTFIYGVHITNPNHDSDIFRFEEKELTKDPPTGWKEFLN